MPEFEIGDHVKVYYFEDRRWYRARVIEGPNEAGWFKVRWKDARLTGGYNTDEWVRPREMQFSKHALQP